MHCCCAPARLTAACFACPPPSLIPVPTLPHPTPPHPPTPIPREFLELGFKYDNLLMEESAQILEIETFIPMLLQVRGGRQVVAGGRCWVQGEFCGQASAAA